MTTDPSTEPLLDPLHVNPPPDDTPVWRYMDFTKYVDLLESRSLFIVRGNLMNDPYEGAIPKGHLQGRLNELASLQGRLPTAEEIYREAHTHRDYIYISRWHASEGESAAMWKLYAKSNDAVAIKTTFGRLREIALRLGKEWHWAGASEVFYYDHHEKTMPRMVFDAMPDLLKRANQAAPFFFEADRIQARA
jgi:hypothetical protein